MHSNRFGRIRRVFRGGLLWAVFCPVFVFAGEPATPKFQFTDITLTPSSAVMRVSVVIPLKTVFSWT